MSPFPIDRRPTRWLSFAVGVLLLAATGVYFWMRSSAAPPIPDIPFEGQDKEVVEAITEARDALVAAPRSADAWGRLGSVLAANDVYPDVSYRCFQEAERLDGTNPRWPYFVGGNLAVNQGNPQEALPKLRRAVTLTDALTDPPPAPRLFFAETLVSVGEPGEATEHFQKILIGDPTNVRAHFGLGLLACSRADWQTGRKHLESCVGSPQARKRAAIQLAVVCERLNDKASAEKHAQLAARLPKDVDWPDAYAAENMLFAVRQRDIYSAVEKLEGQREFRKAVVILDRMVTQNPDDYLPHLMMGRILPQMGEFQTAEVHLLKARRLAPEKTQAHFLLGLVLFHKAENLALAGKTEEAKKVFEESATSSRQALAIQPDFGYAHMALGLALKGLGRRDDAIGELRQAVHCKPEMAEIHLFLGQALAEAGNNPDARYYLQQAMLIAPHDHRAKAALDKLPAGAPPKSKS